nr:MAG TPA: hypothetical protein [Caudoviricetes sp.]
MATSKPRRMIAKSPVGSSTWRSRTGPTNGVLASSSCPLRERLSVRTRRSAASRVRTTNPRSTRRCTSWPSDAGCQSSSRLSSRIVTGCRSAMMRKSASWPPVTS